MKQDIQTQLREACERLRRTNMTLQDLIPLLQQAADALDRAQKPMPIAERRRACADVLDTEFPPPCNIPLIAAFEWFVAGVKSAEKYHNIHHLPSDELKEASRRILDEAAAGMLSYTHGYNAYWDGVSFDENWDNSKQFGWCDAQKEYGAEDVE